MFTQFLAHGSVPLTVVLLVLTAIATCVVLRVLIDFALVVRSKALPQQGKSTPTERR